MKFSRLSTSKYEFAKKQIQHCTLLLGETSVKETKTFLLRMIDFLKLRFRAVCDVLKFSCFSKFNCKIGRQGPHTVECLNIPEQPGLGNCQDCKDPVDSSPIQISLVLGANAAFTAR